jgi:Domain of unknown function (DUF4157)
VRTLTQRQMSAQKAAPSSLARPNRTAPGPVPVNHALLRLQRTVGNQAVQRMLQAHAEGRRAGPAASTSPRFGHDFIRIPIHLPAAGVIQTQLAINTPGDKYEQDADRVAEQVTRMHEVRLQRKCACGDPPGSSGECSKCNEKRRLGLQTKLMVNQPGDIYEQEADRIADQVLATPAHPGVSSSPPLVRRLSANSNGQMQAAPVSVERSLDSPGSPLNPPVRRTMEQHFGHDFSRVRVHSDDASGMSARQINAQAYTSGDHIFFGAGRFSPDSLAGQRLLAHELTHVVQQARVAHAPQIRLIQRDDQHKADDTAHDETEARLNFKDDWRNNFSHYENIVKIGTITYSKTQKEGIKATKTKDAIDITLGKPFATEADEKTRWSWIKTEVIDKNVKTDRFEDLAYDPTHSTIRKVAPPSAVGQYCSLNCPATAAALDHYLRTGQISPAVCNLSKENIPGYGFDISMDTFGKSVDWKNAEKEIRSQLKKHGDFVIIEATRSEKQQKDNNLAPTHYFSIVNVKGKLFAIDAFGGGILSDDINNYITNRAVASTYRIVKGEFKVKEVIPK